MDTLIEIIAELRAENAKLKTLLTEQEQKTKENAKTMLYWYEKHNEEKLRTIKAEENGN